MQVSPSTLYVRPPAKSGPRKAGWMAFPFAAVTVCLLCVDARVHLGLRFLYAEIAMIAFLGAAVFLNSFSTVPISALLFSVPLVILLSISVAISDSTMSTFSAARNVVVLVLMLAAMVSAYLSLSRLVLLLRIFVVCGILCSLLGIYQSYSGLDSAPTVFNLGLVGAADARSEFALGWKLANINNSGVLSQQKALAIGLHQYSNNFAEYLIYVLIALVILRRVGSVRMPAFFLFAFILAFAIYQSQSRTCQLAFGIITAIELRSMFKVGVARVLATLVMSIIVATTLAYLWFNVFSYDGFKTVEGRSHLNMAAIESVSGNVVSILFGGRIFEYYAVNFQDPHNSVLFLWLHFGIIFLLIMLGSFLYLVSRLVVGARSATYYINATSYGGLVACAWLFVYGMTWSVISVGLAGMTWAFIVGAALSLQRRDATYASGN